MSRREIVHRGYDSMLAQVLCDVLRQEGLDARLRGGHASAIFGAGQSSLEVLIDAPEEQAARARELAVAYQSHGDEPGPDDDAGEDAPSVVRKNARTGAPIIAPEVRVPRPRPPIFALGLALIVPGGGHMYGFRGLTGVGVLFAQIGLVVAAATNPERRTAAALTAIGLFLFDAVGGFRAARAWNHGQRPSSLRQLTVLTAALLAAGGLGLAAAPSVKTWRMPQRIGGEPQAPGVHRGTSAPEDLPFPLHLDLDGKPARR